MDTYKQDHFYTNLVILTNHADLITDSLSRYNIKIQTHKIDSLKVTPDLFLVRGISYAAIKNFNNAFSDYDTSLIMDNNYVLAYFCRANSRYELILLIQSLDNYDNQVMIGGGSSKIQEQLGNSRS